MPTEPRCFQQKSPSEVSRVVTQGLGLLQYAAEGATPALVTVLPKELEVQYVTLKSISVIFQKGPKS